MKRQCPAANPDRRRLLRWFGSAAAGVALVAFECSAAPVPDASQRRIHLAGNGGCNACASEIYGGQRASSAQCYGFYGAYDGASICQTCGHSWYSHA